ncbi:hypothetical protein VNO80_15477 [Phaseolus coccineus]|uniref:Uncharacterized protein n=1 Tax=Phaseolus coccineus TaxID=3886 RepID=A0AAN9QZA9_PHACN
MERSSNEKRGNRGVYPIMHNMRTPINLSNIYVSAFFCGKLVVLLPKVELAFLLFLELLPTKLFLSPLTFFISFST